MKNKIGVHEGRNKTLNWTYMNAHSTPL